MYKKKVVTFNAFFPYQASPSGSDRRSPASQRSTPQQGYNTMLLVPEAEEIRVSPIVSKKGYLNILDQKTKVFQRFLMFHKRYKTLHAFKGSLFILTRPSMTAQS